jgi:hypothetical protein
MKRHWWAFDQTDPMQGYEFVPVKFRTLSIETDGPLRPSVIETFVSLQ